jgi:diadenosine tetraphosphate (Ap4A) HIT family hydrolase
VFCSIVAGDAPASIVRRDDRIVAFMDIHPVTPGHVLVVPTVHATCLADLDVSLGAALFGAASSIAAAIRQSGVPCSGINLLYADGADAGQEVFHAHLHVIPRTANDGFRIDVRAWREPPPDRSVLDVYAATIRDALK